MNKKWSFLALPYALINIKLQKHSWTFEEAANLVFDRWLELIRPMQIHSEIVGLLRILDKMKPRTILEIGTANGGTLFLFSRIAYKDATIISIDLPGGRFGGGYPKWREFLYKTFALPGQRLCLLRVDSHKIETMNEIKAILDGKEIDFLFIDGDHTYEGVKRDFEIYSTLVKDGGIIALHDIVSGPLENVGGVHKFWQEIKTQYKSEEIVEDWRQGGYGIGLLFYEKRS